MQTIHMVLNQLLKERKIEKLGLSPKTVYRLKRDGPASAPSLPKIPEGESQYLEKISWSSVNPAACCKASWHSNTGAGSENFRSPRICRNSCSPKKNVSPIMTSMPISTGWKSLKTQKDTRKYCSMIFTILISML